MSKQGGNGTISINNLKKFCKDTQISDDSIWNLILKEFDTNNDGVIDFEEFKIGMLKFVNKQRGFSRQNLGLLLKE